MGSAKHIRNNGEQINIHGHDNYQMPGAYKQMGDMNQNQPARYDDGPMKELKGNQKNLPDHLVEAIKAAPEQPGKISGGAAKYIKESYGAGKTIGDLGAKRDKALDKHTSEIYGGKKGSTNKLGKTMPGFNFFPPENPGNPDEMQSGKILK